MFVVNCDYCDHLLLNLGNPNLIVFAPKEIVSVGGDLYRRSESEWKDEKIMINYAAIITKNNYKFNDDYCDLLELQPQNNISIINNNNIVSIELARIAVHHLHYNNNYANILRDKCSGSIIDFQCQLTHMIAIGGGVEQEPGRRNTPTRLPRRKTNDPKTINTFNYCSFVNPSSNVHVVDIIWHGSLLSE